MIAFGDITWLWVGGVVLLILLLVFRWDGRVRRRQVGVFASDRLVGELLRSYSPFRRILKNTLVALALGLLFVALARPQWGHTWRESSSRGIDVLFAVDCSRSMLANDIKPNRLVRARLAIEDFVARLEGDRVGLVAFAGEAFLQCPLTLDYNAFLQSLDALDTTIISAGGTDLGRALDEAEAAFSRENNFKIVVLLTDGEDLEGAGLEKARAAAEMGMTVYAVGVGTEEGSPIPVADRAGTVRYVRGPDGEVVHSRLDPETLVAIAETTGGFYVPLGPTGAGLDQVYEAGIGSIPEEEISAELQRVPIERFQLAVAAALVLLLLEPLFGTRRNLGGRRLFRRTAPLTVLAVMGGSLLVPAPRVAAAETGIDPVDRYNEGIRLVGEGSLGEAVDAFSEVLRAAGETGLMADALYNLGNTRFLQGEQAIEGMVPEEVSGQSRAISADNRPVIARARALLAGRPGGPPDPSQLQAMTGLLKERIGATREGETALGTMEKRGGAAIPLWKNATEAFQSSLDLAPGGTDAGHNLAYVRGRLENLEAQLDLQRALRVRLEDERKEMERLLREMEEAQKNQEQPSPESESEPQDQGEDEEKEGQDEQPRDREGDRRERPETGEDSPGEESPDQPDEGEGGGEPSDRDLSEAEGGDTREGSESADGDTRSGMAEGPDESEPVQGEPDRQDAPDSEEAQADAGARESTNPDAGMEEPEDGPANGGGTGLTNEEERELAAAGGATAGEEGGDGEVSGPGRTAVIGVMSAEDAARLLDSLKDEERKLPVSRGPATPAREGKDW